MRRFVKLSLLCLVAGAGACSTPELEHPTENLPYAGVRFINAVPDSAGSFGLDFRFVDLLESNAHYRITFRNSPASNIPSAIQYKGAREGNRQFRVFLDDTLQSIASKVLVDMTVPLVKEHNYTAMLWGNGRSASTTAAGAGGDKMALSFWDEDVTITTAGKIKLRVINATSAPIDVYTFVGSTVPGTPTWAAVPAYSKSAYVEVDSGSYNYQIRAAGGVTALVATSAMIAGHVATWNTPRPTRAVARPDRRRTSTRSPARRSPELHSARSCSHHRSPARRRRSSPARESGTCGTSVPRVSAIRTAERSLLDREGPPDLRRPFVHSRLPGTYRQLSLMHGFTESR
jgi:hypothetical protein